MPEARLCAFRGVSLRRVGRGGQTWLVTDNDLESRISEFQQAIEARDAVAADGLLHQDYALCLVIAESVVFPRASNAG